MRKSFRQNKLISYSYSIFAIIVYLVLKCILFKDNSESVHNFASIAGLVNIIILFFLSGNLLKSRYNRLSIWYLIYYAFLQAQNILYAFGFVPSISTSSIIKLMSILENADSVIYSNLFLLFINIGATWSISRNRRQISTLVKKSKDEDSTLFLRAVRTTSVILFLPAAYYLINLLALASTMGYYASFDEGFSTSILTMVCRYALSGWEISLFGIIIATRKKSEMIFAISCLAAMVLCFFAIGERTFPISILICVFCAIVERGYSIKKKYLIMLLPLAYILLVVISLIQTLRGGVIIAVNQLSDALSLFGSGFIAILESISIIGFTSCCLPLTMRCVSGFQLGTTYLFGLTTFMPNVLNIFGETSLGRYSLSRWLKNSLGLSYGPGFSMTAEAYINFGWLGVLVGIIFGFLFVKFVLVNKHSTFRRAIGIGIYFFILTLPRRYFGAVFSDMVFGLLPLSVIYYLYGGFKKKGSKIQDGR